VTRYQISTLARLTGTPRTTLRYYEQAGLLHPARSASGYRLYSPGAVDRLGFIASAKRIGLPLAQIRELLAESDDRTCADVRRKLRPMLVSRIADTQRHTAELLARAGRLRQALAGVEGPPHPGSCAPGCGCFADPDQEPSVAIICTLAEADLPERADQWRALLDRATRREPIDGGWRIRLPGQAAGQAAELAAAEQGCCAFFSFTLHVTSAETLLEVRAPAEAAQLVTALFGPAA
jgi:DNA-binding transcriptional MerR regulator